MSYKKRPIKTDAKSIADFWNQLEIDKPEIEKSFHYWRKRFPSDTVSDLYDTLILELCRKEYHKTFDPSRIKSKSLRNLTLEGKYGVYIFNKVREILSHAYNDKRLQYKREIPERKLTFEGESSSPEVMQALLKQQEIGIWNPKENKKEKNKPRKRKKRIGYDNPSPSDFRTDPECIEVLEITKIMAVLKEHLSDKQYDIIERMMDGHTMSEIADEWDISCQMVRVHLNKIRRQIQSIKGMSEAFFNYLVNRVNA